MEIRLSDLANMGVLELKEEARKLKVPGFRTLRKAELIEALERLLGATGNGAKAIAEPIKQAERRGRRAKSASTEEVKIIEPSYFKIISVEEPGNGTHTAEGVDAVKKLLKEAGVKTPQRKKRVPKKISDEIIPEDLGIMPPDLAMAMPEEEPTLLIPEVLPELTSDALPGDDLPQELLPEPIKELPAPVHMKEGAMSAKGTLVIKPEGYGFLRANQPHIQGYDDIYISPSQIKRFRLRNGDEVSGYVRPPNEGEKNSALIRVEAVNDDPPEYAETRRAFEDLTPIFPKGRIRLETGTHDFTGRVIDLMVPIGMGQRGMIVAQPKVGKTTVLKTIAKAIMENSPEIKLIVLLVDERPEEVTDWIQWIGNRGQVYSSTFDQPADNHIKVAEIVLEIAKRQVEHKKNVCILLDSLTRLTRAYNTTTPSSGRTLSGGLDPAALHPAKRFFGAARNIQDGASLTILATVLVDTGSRMDDMIYEEFKGTGNMEIHLERDLAERRIFPAVDIKASSTRRDELLYSTKEKEAAWVLRVAMASMSPIDQAEFLFTRIKQSPSNDVMIDTVVNSKYASNMKDKGNAYL